MKITFREFIEGVKTQVEKTVASFLDLTDFNEVKAVGPELEDEALSHGKLVGRAFVKSAAGNVIILKYLHRDKVFVRVEQPSGEHRTYQA